MRTRVSKLNERLFKAIFERDAETVETLLGRGADVEARDENGWTPLMCACYRDNVKTLELLLDHGADVEARDKNDQTPLMHASYNNDFEMVELLLRHKADVFAEDLSGKTALHHTKVGFIRESLKKAALERMVSDDLPSE